MAVPYIFVAGTVIDPDQMNDNFTYVLSQTTDSLLRDGSTPMLAALPLYAGSLAAPGLTFDGDANTGIYRSGADTFVFVSGGAAVATVSAGTFTVNGSVALSTPVPVASGGTGDVLAGVIAGLLAQGLSPADAAVAGTYLHGAAGQMLAEEIGPSGCVAGDLLPRLPLIMRQLGQGV